MIEAVIKMLRDKQAEAAAAVLENPADYGAYRELRGRYLGIRDALQTIKEVQDAADR